MPDETNPSQGAKKVIRRPASAASPAPAAPLTDTRFTPSTRKRAAQPPPPDVPTNPAPPAPPQQKYYARPYQPYPDHRRQMRSFVSGKSCNWFDTAARQVALSLKALVCLVQPDASGRHRCRDGLTADVRQLCHQPCWTDRLGGPKTLVILLFSLFVLGITGAAQLRALPMQSSHPRGFSFQHEERDWQANPWNLGGIFRGVLGAGSAAFSRWPGGSLWPAETNLPAAIAPQSTQPPGNYDLRTAPSLTAAQIDQILAAYGSPATGTGAAWVNLGMQYGIDPAFAVAFFIHESSAGTNPNWAGLKPGGATTHNVGNIICAGYSKCYGRFRDYPSWEAGIEDWYRLIAVEYIEGRGTVTLEQIIPIYAPSFENNVQGYIDAVAHMVDGWRTNGVTP